VIIISLIFQTGIKAQEADSTELSIRITKMRLSLPAYAKNSVRYTLEDEVANLITDILERLGVNDVIAGIELDSLQTIDGNIEKKHTIIRFTKLYGIKEAIVVSFADIFQMSVEPEENESYFALERSIFEKNPKQESQTDTTNIYTEIFVLLNFIERRTRDHLGFIELVATHTGGSPKQSKEKALAGLWNKLNMELKKIYWLYADIETTTKGKLKLPFGTNYGVVKGALFELVEPERIWEDEDGEYIVPGGCVGFASVVDTASDSSSLKIIRQWQSFYPGSWMVNFFDHIDALELNFVAPSTDYYFSFGIHYFVRPMQSFDWGFGMRFMQIGDSYGDKNSGVGFSGFGMWRFINKARFDLDSKFGINIDIPFKRDDNKEMVNTTIISAQVEVVLETPLTKNIDFVFSAGYRFGAKASKWEYTSDDELLSAYWENDPPVIDNTGIILSSGFKYYFFTN